VEQREEESENDHVSFFYILKVNVATNNGRKWPRWNIK